MAIVLPTKTKTRTKRIGGERVGSDTFSLSADIEKQSRDDILHMVKANTAETTAEQIKLNNPPNFTLVDGREKPIDKLFFGKTEVFYGAFVQRALMQQVEQALRKAILKHTTARTGALSDIRNNWQWTLVQGKKEKLLGGPQELKQFNYGDYLLLKPKLHYASAVHLLVLNQIKEFFFGAIQPIARKIAYKQFMFSMGLTNKHTAPGEVSQYGTLYLSIRLKARVRRRKK